jgi:hypothetical protein
MVWLMIHGPVKDFMVRLSGFTPGCFTYLWIQIVRMVLRVRTKAKKWVVDGAARLLLASAVLLVSRLSLALSSLQRIVPGLFR